MITIYGVKCVTDNDLFERCGRPKQTMDFVKAEEKRILEDLEEVVLSYSLEGDYKHVAINLSFIPLEIVEEYIYFRSVETAGNLAMSCLATNLKVYDIKESVTTAFNNLKSVVENYYNYEYDEPVEDKIENSACVTFIYDDNKKLKDVCVTIPKLIKEKIYRPMEYKCSKCNHKEFSQTYPENMFYSISDNDIFYYCSDCANSVDEKIVHVGENFY